MKRLNVDNILVPLNEAKTKVLTAFEKEFGKDFVYSNALDFEFNNKTFNAVYKILNAYLFNNKLSSKKLYVYQCSNDELKTFKNEMNIKQNNANYYAAYIPEFANASGKLRRETMLLIDDNGKMTFMFAVACICHEMIHQYDVNYGILSRILREDEQLGIDRSHETPVFVRYMKLAALEGIRVMTNAGTTPFDILNQEAVQFTLNLQEDDNTNFFKLVERLKAGEKIPNVCLTKRDTVAFFIP